MNDAGMHALHVLWDLSQEGALCTVDDLARSVHEAGLEKFGGMDGLHQKVWVRDATRYGSFLVFDSAEARDACLAWITERVNRLTGLTPVRLEAYEVIAVAEGTAGPIPASLPQT
jgi:hypothetical protein